MQVQVSCRMFTWTSESGIFYKTLVNCARNDRLQWQLVRAAFLLFIFILSSLYIWRNYFCFFLHKLAGKNNPVLKACCDMYSHSVEFTLMCYSFDIAFDLCSEVDIRSKVVSAFSHIVHSLWVLLKSTRCISIVLYLPCLSTILMANKRHHISVCALICGE